jgi:CheY-like chemotaxis protein
MSSSAMPHQFASPAAIQPAVVLVVDDDHSMRARLSRLLRGAGYGVMEAGDGRHALRTLATAVVDVIVLDLAMPAMSGWDFRTAQLRDARLSHIPTFVTTSHPLTAHERYSLRIGTALVFQKPFDDARVLDGLARVIADTDPESPSATSSRDSRWRSRDGQALLWSRRGCVACEVHAPSADSDEWRAEGWAWIPRFAGKNKIEYACQACCGGPILHGRRDPLALSPMSSSPAIPSELARARRS